MPLIESTGELRYRLQLAGFRFSDATVTAAASLGTTAALALTFAFGGRQREIECDRV